MREGEGETREERREIATILDGCLLLLLFLEDDFCSTEQESPESEKHGPPSLSSISRLF